MKVYISQRQKLEQKPIISQTHIQILLHPVEELETILEKEDNPFLEISESENEENEENFIRFDDFENYEGYEYYPIENEISAEEIKKREERLYADEGGSFYNSIIEQIYSRFEDEKKRAIAFEILYSLDEKGYLSKSISEIAQEFRENGFDITENEIEEVRKEFMNLEPLGIGSKDATEYISFVIRKLTGENEDIIGEIKASHPEIFEAIEKLGKSDKIINEVVQKMTQENKNISKIIEKIKEKDIPPFPTFGLNLNQQKYLVRTPDIEVEIYGDDIYIYVNSPKVWVRDLRKEEWYKSIKLDEKAKKIVSEKIKRAIEIERGVKMRRDIMQKVAEFVFSYQKEFLKTGEKKNLKPLTIEQISQGCGLSISMVSRAIKGKYVKTPFGIFEFKEFVPYGVKGENEKQKVPQKRILEEIKNIIEQEDKINPYSDSQIVQLIKEKLGIEISRRAVVKYRKKLGIANIEERKELYKKILEKG